jgi:demethylmenaquinone methyltransferase/2-methoxy-6-polyprenyl-1,4-benzoquinol methylase
LAWALARRGAQVTGVDFSESMLRIASTRGRRAGVDSSSPPANPTFIKADAQQLPFPDNSFDIATVGYGLRNLASWEKGLFEMQRVIRPGGRLVALEFGKPDNRLWRTLYFAYLKLCVPVLGKLFCGDADAYGYILESLSHYPAQRGVADKMHGLGLEEVRIINLLGGVMSINFAKKSASK